MSDRPIDVRGRPDDWPPLSAATPEDARRLARKARGWAAMNGRAGDRESARALEALADAFLAEADAVEADDEAAIVAAIAAQVLSSPGQRSENE